MFEFLFKSKCFNKQKQRYEEQEITAIKMPIESHLFWKKHFHENPLCIKDYADFEADK